MPGILPMKMIRVGSSTQSRIAQACDRCRSKKIRCDGVRPTCSQCSNVGFECKTSDKLSRRAFPRGYTESLEDRVRGLEAEIRELKQLLDERDEKIDMLSRIHSFSPMRKNSVPLSPTRSPPVKDEIRSAQEEVLHIETPAPVQSTTTSVGTSTTHALIDAFDGKVQEQGRQYSAVPAATLLTPATMSSSRPSTPPSNVSPIPPRLLSDQYINLFFQEWQPLLPILHRQTFLRLYEQFLANPDAQSLSGNKLAIAQLFLIFEIAAHSSSSKARPSTASYEQQWRRALSSSSAPSLATLQCHVLAQLCYLLKADYQHLLRHRAYAVAICHQLGLHQSQKFLSLSPLEAESRKKVFWCQYALDKFASASTGMPMMLRDCDITADYPADVDDENINEQGFSPALPLELTKISSALALFRMSRILAKTLEQLYPAASSYVVSLKTLHSLSDELDQWHEELPDHLRLRFCNDKPATHLISDRSPILSLGYFYTRSLIHRPILCHGSGSAAASATIILAAAAKHIIQIVDLLDERCMNYTFPVNKQDVLLNAGFSILWQCMDLDDDSKIIKDNQKSLTLVLAKIAKENTPAGADFQKVASSFVMLGTPRTMQQRYSPIESPLTRTTNMPAPATHKEKTPRKHLQAIASRISNLGSRDKADIQPKRRSEVSQTSPQGVATNPFPRNISSLSLISTHSAPSMPQLANTSPRTQPIPRPMGPSSSVINLDYFPLEGSLQGSYPTHNSSSTMLPPRKHSSSSTIHDHEHDHETDNWEHISPDFDPSMTDFFPTIEPNSLNKCISNPETVNPDWNADPWQLSDLYVEKAHIPQSLISFSEESMTSGDDFVFSTAGSSHHGSLSTASPDALPNSDEMYKGIAIPVGTTEDDLDFSPGARI